MAEDTNTDESVYEYLARLAAMTPQELLELAGDEWEFHDNLVQEDLEKFEEAKDAIDKKVPIADNSQAALARHNRRWITAAINANWFSKCPIKVSEIGQQRGQDLKLVATAVSRLYLQSASPTEKKF